MSSNDNERIPTLTERLDNLPLTRTHITVFTANWLGHLFDGYDFFLISFALPAILLAYKLTPASSATVVLSNNIGLLLGALFFGIITDYVGRNRAFQLSILIYAFGTLATIFTPNLALLQLVRVFTGFGLGGEVPLVFAMISEWTQKKNRGLISGITGNMFGVGQTLAGFVASYAFPVWGWQVGFVIGVIPIFSVFLLRLFVPDSPRFLMSRGKGVEAARIIEGMERRSNIPVASKRIMNVSPPVKKVRLAELFTPRYLKATIGLWGFAFFGFYGSQGLQVLLPMLMMSKLHFSVADSIFINFVGTVASTIVGFAYGYFMDVIGRRAWLAICAIMIGLPTLFFASAAGNYVLMLGLVTVTRIFTGLTSGLPLLASEQYDTTTRGTGGGAASSFGRLGLVFAPAMASILLTLNIPTYWFFASFCIPLFIAIPFLLLVKETKRKGLESIVLKSTELGQTVELPND